MTIKWQWLFFNDISGRDMHALLALRQDVFMLEQNSLYQDADKHDLKALHLLAHNNQQLIAYARIVNKAEQAYAIGRIVVSKAYRQQGLGKALVKKCIEKCHQESRHKNITLSAQTQLQTFYQGFGFHSLGAPYDDAGVEHIDMQLQPSV